MPTRPHPRKRLPASAALLALAAITAPLPSAAALVDRGGGMLYDTVLDVTWLADANYARTSGYDADGRMSLAQAVAWAGQLVYGGFSDWRLPTAGKAGADWNRQFSYDGSTDLAYNLTSPRSELSYMYHVNLGLAGEYHPDGTRRSDWGTFGNGTLNGVDTLSFGERDIGGVRHLQAYIYWSGDADPQANNNLAWTFHTSVGFQSRNFIRNENYAWAVRDGDVLPVPAPATGALLALGLGGLGLQRRRLAASRPARGERATRRR